MNDKRSADMDWLYRQEPESTRVLGNPSQEQPSAQASGYPTPPHRQPAQASGYPAPGAAPAQAAGSPNPGATPPSPPRPPSGPPPQSRTPKPRRRRPVLKIVGVALLAWVLFLVGTPIYAWTLSNVVEATPETDRPAEQPGTTILLVGSDSRENLTDEERKKLGTGTTGGQRTDTMMLLYLAPNGRSALVSLPRDSLVSIPGHGENKLNAAYAFGGAPLLVSTIENTTGVRIDGYLEVGFAGLVNLVDAVDGIEICPEEAIHDKDAHLDLEAGCQVIDGVTALGYARMRKSDARGDLGRVERQREVISKVVGKALTPWSVINPIRYWDLNTAAASSLARSSDTGIGQVLSAGMGVAGVAMGSGLGLTVPIANPNGTSSVGSVVIWDESASQEMFNAIANGDMDTLERFAS